MAALRSEKVPAVSEAEAALRALGVRNPVFDLRPVGRGHWFADWSGRLASSDVYLAVTGKGTGPRKVRLVLDAWIVEDVATGKVGTVLTEVFSGRATIRRGRSLLVVPVQVLRVTAGRTRYSASRKLPPDEDLTPWERALTRDTA